MSSICNDKNKKEFLNRVVDITAKINAAVDDLTMLTGSDIKYFNKDEVIYIRSAIDDITSATSLVLTSAVSVVAPDELDKIKLSRPLSATTQAKETQEKYDPEILGKLPDVCVDIVNLIGINQAMKLFKTFGGTTFPIGKGIKFLGGARANALRTILTDEEIKKLQQYFSGEILYLPRCDRLLREVRNREFLNEFAAMRQTGASALSCMAVLPPKYGFSDRYGWQLLRNERESSQTTTRKN
ncbi:hypothetical protein [Pectobacterium sp. B2J-2]|uniref:hypothetical protein n=1 Tax=Pectobacterium sp. B2J-2 TaxID=3385372 RepID=UPI0038FD11C3